MLSRLCALFLVFPSVGSAITVEVVQLFQPLSLHGTDGAGEEREGEEPLQAAVLSRPVAVTGAVPEDLVKAVAMPHKIASNSPAYDVPDANLLNLCKVGLKVEMKDEKLVVNLDVTNLEIPEFLDLTSRQVLSLAIRAVRETLKNYYRELHEEEAMEVLVRITGTQEGNASLRDLAEKFKAGD